MTAHSQLPASSWHGSKISSGLYSALATPEVVGQLYFVTSGTNANKVYIATGISSVSDWTLLVDMTNIATSLEVEKQDNSSTVTGVSQLRFPNDWTINSPATGVATVTPPTTTGSITVKETDGLPNLTGVTEIRVPATLLTQPSAGVAQINIPIGINVSEQDGTPSAVSTRNLIFPNGSLTVDGSNNVSVAFLSTDSSYLYYEDNGATVIGASLSYTFSSLGVKHNDGIWSLGQAQRLYMPVTGLWRLQVRAKVDHTAVNPGDTAISATLQVTRYNNSNVLQQTEDTTVCTPTFVTTQSINYTQMFVTTVANDYLRFALTAGGDWGGNGGTGGQLTRIHILLTREKVTV